MTDDHDDQSKQAKHAPPIDYSINGADPDDADNREHLAMLRARAEQARFERYEERGGR